MKPTLQQVVETEAALSRALYHAEQVEKFGVGLTASEAGLLLNMIQFFEVVRRRLAEDIEVRVLEAPTLAEAITGAKPNKGKDE